MGLREVVHVKSGERGRPAEPAGELGLLED